MRSPDYGDSQAKSRRRRDGRTFCFLALCLSTLVLIVICLLLSYGNRLPDEDESKMPLPGATYVVYPLIKRTPGAFKCSTVSQLFGLDHLAQDGRGGLRDRQGRGASMQEGNSSSSPRSDTTDHAPASRAPSLVTAPPELGFGVGASSARVHPHRELLHMVQGDTHRFFALDCTMGVHTSWPTMKMESSMLGGSEKYSIGPAPHSCFICKG